MAPEACPDDAETARPEEQASDIRPGRLSRLREFLPEALGCYCLTSLIVFFGAILGHDYLKRGETRFARSPDLIEVLNQWDGNWYRRIASDGYSYDKTKASNVAFFPAYPLLGRLVTLLTGCSPALALVVVSNLCFMATFVLLMAYLKRRLGARYGDVGPYVVLTLGLFPTMFYYRMAYSESSFLLCAVLALYVMEARCSLWAVVFVVGLATAARPVGIALLLPLVYYIGQQHAGSRLELLGKLALALPLACWGLFAYIVYLWVQFDAPLAFAQTQAHWKARPPVSIAEHTVSLLVLEPVWSVYVPASHCYWARQDPGSNPMFSLLAANPVYFLLAVSLIVLGWHKGWLNAYEISLSAGFLLIPYLTRSHPMCMASMGRFASAAFPMFIVLGHVLAGVARPISIALLAWSGFLLGVYSAFFAAWYRFF